VVPGTPVKAVVALVGVVMDPPAPETMLQRPEPIVGELPNRLAVFPQTDWSGPALGAVGVACSVITTSSVDGAQGAFVIDQRKVYTVPAAPVKAEVGLDGVVTVPPAPETMLHDPVPTVAALAAKVTLPPQTVWSGPAFATVGLPVKVMTTSSLTGAQGAFVMVQRSV
jgi:hypothetical protein